MKIVWVNWHDNEFSSRKSGMVFVLVFVSVLKITADTVMIESQRLLSLQTAQTPLKGGESTPMHDADFGGITPKPKALQVCSDYLFLF